MFEIEKPNRKFEPYKMVFRWRDLNNYYPYPFSSNARIDGQTCYGEPMKALINRVDGLTDLLRH